MIGTETEWHGRELEELTSFDTEKNSQAERGNGVDSKRCARRRNGSAKKRQDMKRSGEESVEME